ncbi:MAG: prepilin-type N-terminal cleavage/methylation domain-containing protein [candidate division NC10 bacterium]|nr:prepilin-type N-terminal cleavage/methylation domain-containing protein [candidate division NC10 bacterium]
MRLQHRQKGFTLVEVVVFSAIFTIVLAGVYQMYWTSHTTFTRGKTKVDVHQHARVALERMTMEIRMAGFDPMPAVIPLQGTCCGLPTTAIQAASANAVQFIGDVESTGTAQRVQYRLVGGQVLRDRETWAGGAWTGLITQALADNLPNPLVGEKGLQFTYRDASSNPTAVLANIRLITIEVIVQDMSTGKTTESIRLRSDIRPRNL